MKRGIVRTPGTRLVLSWKNLIAARAIEGHFGWVYPVMLMVAMQFYFRGLNVENGRMPDLSFYQLFICYLKSDPFAW